MTHQPKHDPLDDLSAAAFSRSSLTGTLSG
jgi:hypothetical protein